MQKRLNADIFFTPQKDFYNLSRHLSKTSPVNWHCHEYYEVEIITDGTSVDQINGVPYVLNRGDFIILQPDDYHCIQGCDDAGTDLVNIAVSVSLMQEILAFLEIEDPQVLSWPITGHLPQSLTSRLAAQAQEMFAPTKQISRERGIIKQWMTTCLLCCDIHHKTDYSAKIPVWLQQLIAKLKTPEGIQGGIEYLKLHIDYSYPHVCRCFQKYLQQTPVEWINEQRLIYSAHLLLYTDHSVLEISLECGFHNLSHFNHLFKAFYGVSPKTFRSLL